MNNLWKKITVLLLVFSLACSLGVPGLAVEQGEIPNLTPDPVGSLETDYAQVGKTAAPTNQPNTHLLTLSVQGGERTVPANADVVFVLDRSQSMKKSLKTVQKNCKDFIASILTENSGNRVGLVSFDDTASKDASLTEYSEKGLKNLKDTVDGYKASGYTNTQMGIHLAGEMLKESNRADRYIVLLSDGAPTRSALPVFGNCSVTCKGIQWNTCWGSKIDMNGETGKLITGYDYTQSAGSNERNPGVTYWQQVYAICNFGQTHKTGDSVLMNCADCAIAEAEIYQDKGIKILAVGFEQGETGKKALTGMSDQYFDAGEDNLKETLKQVASSMKASVKNAVVTDPIAPAAGADLQLAGDLAAATDANLTDGTYYATRGQVTLDKETNTLTWTLGDLASGETETLSYLVKWNVETAAFSPEQVSPLNGAAKLTYQKPNEEESSVLQFPIPTGTAQAASIQVVSYGVNGVGEPIDKTGTPVQSPQEAEVLKETAIKNAAGGLYFAPGDVEVPLPEAPEGYQLYGENTACTTVDTRGKNAVTLYIPYIKADIPIRFFLEGTGIPAGSAGDAFGVLPTQSGYGYLTTATSIDSDLTPFPTHVGQSVYTPEEIPTWLADQGAAEPTMETIRAYLDTLPQDGMIDGVTVSQLKENLGEYQIRYTQVQYCDDDLITYQSGNRHEPAGPENSGEQYAYHVHLTLEKSSQQGLTVTKTFVGLTEEEIQGLQDFQITVSVASVSAPPALPMLLDGTQEELPAPQLSDWTLVLGTTAGQGQMAPRETTTYNQETRTQTYTWLIPEGEILAVASDLFSEEAESISLSLTEQGATSATKQLTVTGTQTIRQAENGDATQEIQMVPGQDATAAFTNTYTQAPIPGNYRITYVYTGSYFMEPEQDTHGYGAGAVVPLPEVERVNNYTFYGWESAVDDQGNPVAITDGKLTMPEGNVTVTGRWSRNSDGNRNHVPLDTLTTAHVAYLTGYEDGTVKPNYSITRAEVASIFFRLLTEGARESNLTQENRFSDSAPYQWFHTAVSTLTKVGILQGYTDGSFHPNAPITRGELAAIIARFAELGGTVTVRFSDIDGHWAKDSILLAASNGWITGYEDGTFRPNQSITRAETVTMLNRVLKRLPENTDALLQGMKTYSDNLDPSAWYYLAIQEASTSHDSKLLQDKIHEKWTKLTTQSDWSVFEDTV